MHASPAVTVLLPVYNDRRFVGGAVQSILDQTFRNFELFVLDDGSTDGSIEIVRGFRDARLRIASNERNLGLARTLNQGLELARGELIARMDADDISEPDRFARQVAFLGANPRIALVGTWVRWIDEDGRPFTAIEFPTEPSAIESRLLQDNCIFHPSVMFRRGAVLGLGGYRASAALSQDYDLWLRLSEQHALANLPEYLLRYRIHRAQQSVQRIGRQRRAANAMRFDAAMRRYRAGRIESVEGYSPPPLIARLRGDERSTGAALLFWSRTFSKMGRRSDALVLSALACAHSPLSARAYAAVRGSISEIVWPPSKRNLMRWYSTRLRSLLAPSASSRNE